MAPATTAITRGEIPDDGGRAICLEDCDRPKTADPGASKTVAHTTPTMTTPANPPQVNASPKKNGWSGLVVVVPMTSALASTDLAGTPQGQVVKALIDARPAKIKAWWMGSDGKFTPFLQEISVEEPDPIAPFARETSVEGLLKVASAELSRQGFAADGEAIESVILWSSVEPPKPPAPASKAPVGWSMMWMSPAVSSNPALETFFGRKGESTDLRFFALNDPAQNIADLLLQMIPKPRSATP